ncbi:hypothetical protein Sp245p_23045 (plasmid) [Azospirillum baldaniorum]|nr:hypothetical protein Sp245p_23045 [Azospirillum baldaniorum]
MRGLRVAARSAKAQPPHPNPLPAFGGPKVRLSRQRKLRLRVSGGERGQLKPHRLRAGLCLDRRNPARSVYVRAAPTASMDRPWTNCTRCASSSASSRSTASPRPPTRWACRAPR